MTAPAPALAADLVAGLRRLKLARIRAIAPEVCQAAKTQRWAPDEFLRTLIEAEIASRDESNLRARLKLAGFPSASRWTNTSSSFPQCLRPPSTTSLAWSGSALRRTACSSGRRGPASRTCCWPSGMPR
jgi:hypothetical protein